MGIFYQRGKKEGYIISNNKGTLLLAMLALAFVVIIATPSIFKPKAPIEVAVSLNPTSIKENETSKLTLSVKNTDLKTHTIRFVFDTNPLIAIYAGSEQLLHNNAYSFAIEASDPSEERVFTVAGSLDEKVSSSDYPIAVHVYVDGNALSEAWNDVVLTIRQ